MAHHAGRMTVTHFDWPRTPSLRGLADGYTSLVTRLKSPNFSGFTFSLSQYAL